MASRTALICSLFIAIAGIAIADEADYREDLIDARRDYERYYNERNWPGAMDAAARLMDIASAAYEDGDARLAAAGITYARMQARMDDRRDALRTLERLAENTANANGDKSVEMIPILVAQGDLVASRRRVQWQLDYYEDALDITKSEYGRDSVKYAELALDLGIKVLTLSMSGEGLIYIKRAHQIFDAEYGQEDFRTAQASFIWGVILRSSGSSHTARRHLSDAVAGFDLDSPHAHAYHIKARELLAGAFLDSGNEDEAMEELLEIARIRDVYGESFVTKPVFIGRQSKYPMKLRRQEIEGVVRLQFTIDENGFVRQLEVLEVEVPEVEGSNEFVDAAIESVASHRYVPLFVDGEAVAVSDVKFTVNFKL
jgi:TonB family protein